MPDVAVFLGLPFGQVSFSAVPVAGDTVTKPSARRYVVGPPVMGTPSYAAQYILQVPSTDAGQTANTYRYVADVPFGAAAPTTWSYFGNAFVSLGGL
jgi:hypothetical protein